MNQKKHTEGSWEAGRWTSDEGPIIGVQVGLERQICRVSPVISADDQDEANALLIAAAPDLLEACRMALITLLSQHSALCEIYEAPCQEPDVIITIEQAIKKAEEGKERGEKNDH